MKIKSILSFLAGLGIAILTLTACKSSSSPNAVAATAKTTSSILQTWTEIYSDTGHTNWSDALSPDGRWLIPDLAARPGMPMQIIFTDIPTRTIQLAVDPGLEQGWKDITIWSPDSTAIAVPNGGIEGPCDEDRLLIYRLVDQDHLERSVFFGHEDRHLCLYVSWSPDGSRLLIQDSETIYILDRQAQLLHQIPMEIPIQVPRINFYATWTARGILVVVDYDNRALNELWLINPDNPDDRQVLLKSEEAFFVVGMDLAGKQVLLNTYIDNPGIRLKVFDIESRQVIHEISQPGHLFWGYFPSVPLGWVGFVMAVPNLDGSRHFFVFDWVSLELKDYTEKIQHPNDVVLFGWQTRVKGFLFLYPDEPQGPIFEVVQP